MHNPAVILPDAFGRPGRAGGVHEPGAGLRRDCRKIRACRRCGKVIADWQDRQLFGGKRISQVRIHLISDQKPRVRIGQQGAPALN